LRLEASRCVRRVEADTPDHRYLLSYPFAKAGHDSIRPFVLLGFHDVEEAGKERCG
jgi:hypothetical protein